MLPDFIKAKKKFQANLLQAIMKNSVARSSLISSVKRHILYEGRQLGMHRANGEIEVSDLKQLEATHTIEKKDIDEGQPVTAQTVESVSKQLAEGQEQAMIDTLNEGIEKVGNTIDGRGRPMGPDLILEMLDKILIDFDGDQPRYPTFMAGNPNMRVQFEKAITQLHEEEPHKSKFTALLKKKKEDFLEREASRKLVD